MRFVNPPPCSGDEGLIIPIEVWDPDDDPVTITFDTFTDTDVIFYKLGQNEVGAGINFTMTVKVSDEEFEDDQIYQLRTVTES